MRIALGSMLCGMTFVVATPGAAFAQAYDRSARVAAAPPMAADTVLLGQAYAQARALPRLRSLLVHWRGSLIREQYFRGATRAQTDRASIK